jgi:capsular polysaccharide biosynthesis protein
MDFKDQVRLFSECALVIGAHGAGLSNVSLMPQGAQVVEVLSPRRLWPTYRGVAARSGVRYYPYVAASVGTETTNDSDIDVNIDHLLDFVNRVRQTGVSA